MSEHLDTPNPELWVGFGFGLVGVSIFIAGSLLGITIGAGHGLFNITGGLNFIVGVPFLVGLYCIGYGFVLCRGDGE